MNVTHLAIETSHSNLRGVAQISTAPAAFEIHVDSTGLQASDALAWYRAFQPGVDDKISASQFFTGAAVITGWPLRLQEAAFSSEGGEARLPGLQSAVRIGPVSGGLERSRLSIDPVRISYGGARLGSEDVAKRQPPADGHGSIAVGISHDFTQRAGSLSVEGHVEKMEDVLRVAAEFGRPLNHGWEASGPAAAALRLEWSGAPLQARWSGHVDASRSEVQVAGLNQPLQLARVRLQWKDGLRSADIGLASGFGASWSGAIAQTELPEAGANPRWHFQLHADRLDASELDRWIGPRARPGWLQRLLPSLIGGGTENPAASELVRRVNADGELRIDEFTLEKLKLQHVRVLGALQDLRLDVRDAEGQLAGGSVRGNLSAKFLPRPSYEVSAELDRVNLAELPAVLSPPGGLRGLASGTVRFTMQGVGRQELLQKLAGKGELHVRGLELRGWDVAASVADGQPRPGQSYWSSGAGNFTLRDRQVVLDRLRLESGDLVTFVKGTVSFTREAELTMQTVVRETPSGASTVGKHVLRISGPLDLPRVSVENLIARQPAD